MPVFRKKAKKRLGSYIHVPFCRSKCIYCDFYSVTAKEDAWLDGYLDAVCAHIRETAPLAPDYLVDTIYFGGGTPSFLGADALCTLLATVRKSFAVSANAEITFEANPDSVSEKLLAKLRAAGFNRISLGIQSDDDAILKKIGRPHSYAQAVSAVKKFREAGFRNLSVDLIYGLPGQTLAGFQATLENVLTLKPEHISCYGLKVEEGTPLHQFREFYNLPDDDAQADLYLAAVRTLRDNHYRQYEISNFCRQGRESRHNLKYWTGGEYLGFGPDASSDFAGRRFRIVRDLGAYIDAMHTLGPVLAENQVLTRRDRATEYLMLRLRTSLGVSQEEYEASYLLPFAPLEECLAQCRARGHAQRDSAGRWTLTPEGMLISNAILSDLLLVQEKTLPFGREKKNFGTADS